MTGIGRRSRLPAEDDLATVFARALQDQHRTLAWVRDRLSQRGVSVSHAALSYWRSGQRRPEGPASLEALAEIEDLLRLPEGALCDRVGPSRRTGPMPWTAGIADLVDDDHASPIERALADLGLDSVSCVDEAVSFTVDIGSDRHLRRWRFRSRIRATQDGVSIYPLWFYIAGPLTASVDVASVDGATPGRRVEQRETGCLAMELVLERALRVGETAIVEATLTVPPVAGAPDCEFVLHPPRRTPEVEVWVRFDPSAPPSRCTVSTQQVGGRRRDVAVDLADTSTVHHAGRAFGPGSLGVHWQWDEGRFVRPAR